MKRIFLMPLALFLLAASPPPSPHWTKIQVEQFFQWATQASKEGLEVGSLNLPAIRRALVNPSEPQLLDSLVSASAVRLLNAFRHGCCNLALKPEWRMTGNTWSDPASAIIEAVRQDRIDELFERAQPSHPFYRALAQAYGREDDPARRAILAANMDRWRWMPRDLGKRYLLVNSAAFEASLWENGTLSGRWAVIVGKTTSPTPIFQAQVTGITFNPWWEIPPSIAAENIAALLTRHPAEAARKGYVLENDRYRQRPGPENALGRMKLVMPNNFSVYLHDTPARSFFTREVRAYSHGCVRVGDAIGLAAALLAPSWDRSAIDMLVEQGKTRTVPLPATVPVYVAYFTAEPDDLGGARYFPDVHNRDQAALAPNADGVCAR